MLLQTHVLLANKLIYQVQVIGDWAKRNRLAFYWGNVRPDLHTPLTRGTHMYDLSVERAQRVWSYAEQTSSLDSAVSSYCLGYVLHYVADFFTYVHNDKNSMINLGPHFAYEKELHKRMQKIDLSCLEGDFTGDFRAYIDNLRADYLAGEHNPVRDCSFICASAWALTQWAVSPALAGAPAFA